MHPVSAMRFANPPPKETSQNTTFRRHTSKNILPPLSQTWGCKHCWREKRGKNLFSDQHYSPSLDLLVVTTNNYFSLEQSLFFQFLTPPHTHTPNANKHSLGLFPPGGAAQCGGQTPPNLFLKDYNLLWG